MSSQACGKCCKTVYQTEKVEAASKWYHKGCFKCEDPTCGITLSLKTFQAHSGQVWCDKHVPKHKAAQVADSVAVVSAVNAPKKSNEGLHKIKVGTGETPSYGIETVANQHALNTPRKPVENMGFVHRGHHEDAASANANTGRLLADAITRIDNVSATAPTRDSRGAAWQKKLVAMGSTEELGSGDDLLQQAFPGARRTTKKKVSADEEPSDTPWKNSGYDPWSRRTSVNISASVALFNVIDPEKASHGHGIHAIYDQGDAPWLITERRVANSVTGAMDIDEEDEDETTPAPANAAALSSAALAAVKNYGRREVPTYKAEEILEDGEDDEMEQEEVQSSKTSTISLIRGSESSLMTGDLQEGETQEEAVLDQGSVESDIYESYGAFGMIDSKSSSPIEKFQTEPEPAVAKRCVRESSLLQVVVSDYKNNICSTANVFLKSAAASSHSLRPKPKSSTGTAMPSVERLNDSDAVHLPENDDGFKIIFPLSIQTEAATGRVKDMRYPVLSLCEERAQRGIDPWVAANRDVLPILASMLKEQDAAAQVERERRARRGKEKARDMSVLDMNVVMESTVASGVGVGSGPVKDAQPMSAEVIPRSKAKSVVWPRDFLQVNGVIEEGRASVRREVDRSMAKLNAGVSERLSTRKSIFESWSSSRTQNPPVVRHAPSAPRLYALRIRVSSAFSRIPQASARARPRTSMVAMAVAGTSTSIGVEAHMRRAAVSGRLPKEENPTCSLISADRSASMLPNSMTYVLSEQEAEMIVSRTENAPAEDAKLKLAVEGANFSKSVRIDESSLVKPGWRDVNARLTRSTGGARRLVISPGKRSQSSRELLLRCPSVAEQDSYEKEDLDVLVDWEDTSSSVSNEGTHVESETKAEEEEGAPNTMDVTQKPPKIPRLNAPASEEKGLTSASGDSLRSGGGGSIQSESRIHEYGTSRQASETTLPDTTSPSNDAIEQSDPATDRLSNSALDREPHPAVDRSGNPYPKGVYRIPVNPPDVKVHRTKLKSVFSTQWVDSVECAGWGADVTPRLSKRSSRVECKLPLTATPTNSANVYRRPLPLAGEADFVTGPENEKGQKIIKPRPRDPDGDQVYREKSAPIPDAAEVPIPATTEPPPELETVEVMEQSVKPAEQPKWHRKEQSAAPRKPVRIMNIQLPLLDSPARTSQPRVRVRLDQKEDPDNFDARKDKFAPGKALMKPFAYTPLQSKLAIVAPRLHPKLFMTLRPLSTLKMYEAAHQGTIGRAGTPAALEESPSPYLAAERLNPTPEGLELPPGTPTDAPSATATSPEPSLHEQADQRRQETEAIPAKDLASDSDLISVLSAVPTASPNHRLQSPTPSTFTVVSRFNGPNLPLTSPTPWGRSRPSTAATEREEPVKKAPPRSSTFLNRPAGVPRVSNT
ncbi:hypothetical protein HK101_011883 [Irineochytrium annulatum]|nr:hypothetical protein HK101_011883 [Irineochytrium annulatum]